MGFTTYLREGVELANNAYNRFNPIYQQDRATAIQASHQYQGNVTSSAIQGQISKRILDSAIEVLTVTDEVRTSKLDFWNKHSVKSLGFGVSGLVLTIMGTGGAVAAKTFLVGSLAIAVPVAAGTVAVVGVALAILGFCRYSQANEQYEAWQDPLAAYQVQRQRTGSEGFSYVFSSQLKGSLVHPEECRQLWTEWSDREMPNYQYIKARNEHSPETVKKVKQFFKSNPLDAKAMDYAFEGVTPAPQNIKNLSTFYNDIKLSYSDVRAKAEKERNKIECEKNKLIRKNESNREAWLAPAKLVKDSLKSEAYQKKSSAVKGLEAVRDQTIQEIRKRFAQKELSIQEKNEQEATANRTYSSHPIVIAAEEEYRNKCRKAQLLYDIASAPINYKFDKKNEEIKEWADRQIAEVNEKENRQISYFARDVQGIAQAYVDATNYNRAQEEMEQQEHLYPQLDLFVDLNQAYVFPSSHNAELNAVDLGQFYQQIYQQPQPSAPPLD